MCTHGVRMHRILLTFFPSQALPWAGSLGLISAPRYPEDTPNACKCMLNVLKAFICYLFILLIFSTMKLNIISYMLYDCMHVIFFYVLRITYNYFRFA